MLFFLSIGVILVCIIVYRVWRKRTKEAVVEVEGGQVQGHAPNPLQPANVPAANDPLYADDNLPPDINAPEANNMNDHLEGVQDDHVPDLLPHPEANDPVVAGVQLVDQAMPSGSLGIGVIDVGSVPSNIHEVHCEQPGIRSNPAASNADAISVCKVPTEETRLQENPLQPVQEVGKRGGGVVFRGVQDTRLSLVRTGDVTEVRG